MLATFPIVKVELVKANAANFYHASLSLDENERCFLRHGDLDE